MYGYTFIFLLPSPFLVPSASPLLTLFPFLFLFHLVSFPFFLLQYLNPFPSPLCYFPLFALHFTLPILFLLPYIFTYFSHSRYLFPFLLSSSFLLHLPCHSSSLFRFLSLFPFTFSFFFSCFSCFPCSPHSSHSLLFPLPKI